MVEEGGKGQKWYEFDITMNIPYRHDLKSPNAVRLGPLQETPENIRPDVWNTTFPRDRLVNLTEQACLEKSSS